MKKRIISLLCALVIALTMLPLQSFAAETVTINVYNSLNAVIYSVTIEDVRFAANTKTLLSGNLFTSPSASVSVNHSWNKNIVGNF